jgi:mono/diheme cytochrome c family protein
MRMSHPMLAALAALLAASVAPAHAEGDAKAGKALHDKDCTACHARQFGGDGTKIYTRADRRVTTLAKLRAQVAACNTQLPTRYFPDEEEHVVAYLNQQFYKFKP